MVSIHQGKAGNHRDGDEGRQRGEVPVERDVHNLDVMPRGHAAGNRNLRGEPGAFRADRVLHHLHHD